MLLTPFPLKICSNTNSSYNHYYNYYNNYTNACKDHYGICLYKKIKSECSKKFLHNVLREGSVENSPDFIELLMSPIVISLDLVPSKIEQ